MTAELQQVIDAAWEERDASARHRARSATRSRRRSGLLDSGEARVAEKGAGGWTVNQWLKKAVLLSFRLNPMEAIPGGPGGARLVGQGAVASSLGWGAAAFDAAGFRAVPGRDRPPRRLHRPQRGADAELRQYRRLCRRGDDGRHLGDGRQLRPDRRATSTFPAAPASAACSSRCRPGR